MDLRKATKADLKDIKDLYTYYIFKTFATQQREDRSLEYYEKMRDDHGKTHPIFIAEMNGQFVGSVAFRNSDRRVRMIKYVKIVYI